MKTSIAFSAFLAGAMLSMAAATLGFDSLPAGSNADPALANSYGLGQVSFSYASFGPSLDPATGDAAPGTEHWGTDFSAGIPAVSVANPILFGRGSAPSGVNALNALDQPVLLYFNGSSLQSFKATLDRSTRTGNASPFQEVLYLNDAGTVVKSQTIDTSKSLATFQAPALEGVSMVVLPGGKFYDNLAIVTIPEPGTLALLATAGGLLVVKSRRRIGSRL